jgi:nucleoside-diphosphate-sugar epimerase
VITGAAGHIGRAIAPLLPPQWQLHLTDVAAEAGVTALDITDPDACERVFQDANAVVHLAAVPDPTASWDRLVAPNVIGAYHVAHAAADVGVRRLVLASSLHAVSAVPETTQARGDDAPRPGTLYGATKAWAEALGAWVAATTSTTVVALRIGYFAIEPPDLEQVPTRDLTAWLSARDAAELVRAAVESEGLTFVVANGISANRFRRADIEQTVSRLGYQPVDDAWAQLTDRELRSGRHG